MSTDRDYEASDARALWALKESIDGLTETLHSLRVQGVAPSSRITCEYDDDHQATVRKLTEALEVFGITVVDITAPEQRDTVTYELVQVRPPTRTQGRE